MEHFSWNSFRGFEVRRLLGYVLEGLQKNPAVGWGGEKICTKFADLTIVDAVGMNSTENPSRSREGSTPKRKRLDERLERENADQIEKLERENADLKVKLQRLERDLDVAEHRNSQDFPGGESFQDTCATPHLLNKAVERVYSASGYFTKLVMHALQHHGSVDCAKAARTVAKTVVFERAAHTKFVYQALVCKALFSDFENEYFNVDENAPESVLDLESSGKENFQRYKELTALENIEELAYDDATDNDFRRLCNKKRQDLVFALSESQLAPGVADVGALLFGKVYRPQGIRRSQREHPQYQVKIASSFVKFVHSVFLVHNLAFALRPSARIFRVRDGATFNATHMEAVLASADCDDDDAPLAPLTAAIMVVPGFHVNRITVHSKVYTVKKIGE